MKRRATFARGASSVFEALRDLEADGFAEDMTAREGGRVLCGSCGKESPAGDLRNHGLYRIEGASDPADMSAVAGVSCPACGSKGVLVMMYGPEAGPEDNDVLSALPQAELVDGEINEHS